MPKRAKPSPHILHLEDDPKDAALVRSTLEAAGISCKITCVSSRQEFESALEQGGIDLILSDFSLSTFDGLTAMAIAEEKYPEIPVILVSGTAGRERAIDCTGCILKDGLSRLAPAVRKALQEIDTRVENREMEAQLITAQKMEVIGHLAGGIAHDFNNILAVIMGYSDLMLSELPSDSPLKGYAEEIRLASERATGLTRQLLVFSRKQGVKFDVLDLNEVLRDLEAMIERLIGENIEMRIEPADALIHVEADSGYIGQILMNLIVNARDAMPNGGKLTLSTANITLTTDDAVSHPGIPPGIYAAISVQDTGVGMTEEVKEHLFEAFYTTKPPGQGTGLGLATCRTIVEQSNGFIEFESEPGRGTTFRVFFPGVDRPLAPKISPEKTESALGGTETLLVVEDDPSVLHLARGLLQARGYNVLTAANGQEALRVARENAGPGISLVITDVIMPLMNGKVMAEWLKMSYPDLKVLFTSGYTDEVISKHGVLEEGVDFLPKPYSAATLTRKVREMLDPTYGKSNDRPGK